jgi:acetyl-coA carboxylase, carboxyl transferase, beta subunit
LEKGAIDQIVDRRSMKKRISDLITLLRHEGKVTAA